MLKKQSKYKGLKAWRDPSVTRSSSKTGDEHKNDESDSSSTCNSSSNSHHQNNNSSSSNAFLELHRGRSGVAMASESHFEYL